MIGQNKSVQEPWVCIDFGTCNTVASIIIDGEPHLVKYGTDSHFPTLACVMDDGTVEVCQQAEPLRTVYPENFKQEFKLQIADYLEVNGVGYSEIIAAILRFVKGCAENENNGAGITNVILTIPAIYTSNDPRKSVMDEAARMAGFKKIEFLSEPTAAAMHYAHIAGNSQPGLTVVYDLGGGTFDPALVEVAPDGRCSILGNCAGVKCGGHFFDRAIYKYIADRLNEAGQPLERKGRLADYAACRRLKEALSVQSKSSQVFSNGKAVNLTRDEFDTLVAPLIELTLKSLDEMMSTSGRSWSQVNRVLLVGGSSAIPLIREMLRKHLISHNASGVEIIRNTKGRNGTYDHNFATALGGITGKIVAPPPPPEPLGTVTAGTRTLTLHEGVNRFGRGSDAEFRFDDPAMSRLHFAIKAVRKPDGKLTYSVESLSTSRSTILNSLEALDTRYVPVSRAEAELTDGATIGAGHTTVTFRRGKIEKN